MDQKALKKRLKVLMQRPENQICSDCPEKKPTWASLIVAPPGAPPGTQQIGAFCCLECSGSHRRLGVHISFVRSVNLDSWKEREVQAMENGGNYKVNAIFEARLAQSGVIKPSNLANGPTRERFIRDKYERRKFYDPAGYQMAGNGGGGGGPTPDQQQQYSSSSGGPPPQQPNRPGAPSEAARQRVASRQARMKPSHSGNYGEPTKKSNVAKAPVSAPPPVVADLLDFGSSDPTPSSSSQAVVEDLFATAPPIQSPPKAPPSTPSDAFGNSDPFAPSAPQQQQQPASMPQQQANPAQHQQQQAPTGNNNNAFGDFADFASASMQMPSPQQPKPAATNNDIMALFNTPSQLGFGMASPGMGGMNKMGMIMPQQQQQPQQSHNNNHHNNNSNNMMMMMMQNGGGMQGARNMSPQMQQQQQQQQAMMANMMNPQMMAMMNNNNNAGTMQQQQQMMMLQRQQQQQMMMMNNNNSNGAAAFNNNMNAMMQGMQQFNLGGNMQHMQQQQQPSPSNGMDNGFTSSPMGGMGLGTGATTAASTNEQPKDQSNDPFSGLGGMNAFR